MKPRSHADLSRRTFLGSGTAGALGGLSVLGVLALPGSVEAADLSDKEKANVAVVNEFCAAWKSGDAAKAGACLADNCTVRFLASTEGNPPVNGKAAVVEQIAKYLSGMKIEFVISETFAKGPIVVNRRVDKLVSATGPRDIQIVGVFFVTNGKIREWHDFAADV